MIALEVVAGVGTGVMTTQALPRGVKSAHGAGSGAKVKQAPLARAMPLEGTGAGDLGIGATTMQVLRHRKGLGMLQLSRVTNARPSADGGKHGLQGDDRRLTCFARLYMATNCVLFVSSSMNSLPLAWSVYTFILALHFSFFAAAPRCDMYRDACRLARPWPGSGRPPL